MPEATPTPVKPSLSALPDDILVNIISFLPALPPETTSRHLKQAYENLSLARLQPRYAYFSNSQVENVTIIDPFPEVSHFAPVADLPPYARPSFLAFLVALCRNLDTLRAPCLTGVLQYAGQKLSEISFIDTGLTDADLLFLSRSSLTYISIKNPSPPVLTALAQVKQLEHVTLRGISEYTLPHVLNFLACTCAKSFYASVDTTSEQPLLALLKGLPDLESFVLKCEVHQLWALRYLRKIAMEVEFVEMIVGGVTIEVLGLDGVHMDCNRWDIETMRRLICRKDLGPGELSSVWRDCMSIHTIDLDVCQQAIKQGVMADDIDDLLDDYFKDEERDFEDILIRFGPSIPSMACALQRLRLIAGTGAHKHVTNLVISQDIVLYSWKGSCKMSEFLHDLLYKFRGITTMQLCSPGEGRAVSARFVMGLPNFLSTALSSCRELDCVYLEDAGELVLQNVGMPILTDETRVKEMIKAVIFSIRKLEATQSVEMGTVIAQLELWAKSDLRVVDGKDLDDFAFSSQDMEQRGSNDGSTSSESEYPERDWRTRFLSVPSVSEHDSSERGSSEDDFGGDDLSDHDSSDPESE